MKANKLRAVRLIDQRVCLVLLDDPWGPSHGGTQRSRAMIAALAKAGCETHVVYLSHAESSVAEDEDGVIRHSVRAAPMGENPRLRGLASLKRRYLPMPTIRGAAIAGIRAAVASSDANLLVASQLRAAQYLQPGQKLWFDQVDVLSNMLDNEVLARRGLARWTSRAQQFGLARNERGAAAKALIVTAAGYRDAEDLSARTGRNVTWLPNPVFLSEPVPDLPPERVAGMLGNFRYWPNRDAYTNLAETWLEPLTARGWRVVVAGHESETLPRVPGIEVIGAVDNLIDYYRQVRLTIAPIRLGAGIKVKVLESLVYGRPVLGTAFAYEGLPASIASRLGTADSAAEIGAALDSIEKTDHAETFALATSSFSGAQFEATVRDLLDHSEPW